ncbi:alpha/beta hydrolase [bacterium]|nr:alpha/beta hydrolase [bacterium]
MSNKTEQSHPVVTLKDGRKIGYVEYGVPNGRPIFYFHGFPGSRLDAGYLQRIALLLQYRLIGIDRPGMGFSSFAPRRSILSWVDDVEAVANGLNIDKLSIIGHSGGAPFVAACAYKISHRLNGAAIVSGMAPFEYPEATASLASGQRFINKAIKAMPWIATVLMKITFAMTKRPRMLKQMLMQLPEVDKHVIQDEANSQVFINSTKEAFRQGMTGAAYEFQLILRPWGFKLEDIDYPITIWQGGLDKQTPIEHANLYAKLIPKAKLTLFKKEGHLSVLVNHGDAILRSICP